MSFSVKFAVQNVHTSLIYISLWPGNKYKKSCLPRKQKETYALES